MEELKPNTWSFVHEDCTGTVSTRTFEADTWTEALQQFVVFMKGLEFIIHKDDIQLHERREELAQDWLGYFCPDAEETSVQFCGNPAYYAFNQGH